MLDCYLMIFFDIVLKFLSISQKDKNSPNELNQSAVSYNGLTKARKSSHVSAALDELCFIGCVFN